MNNLYIIGIILAFAFVSCEAPQEPEFRKLEKVTFNGFSLKKPYTVTLDANAIFHNPNSIGANITEMDLDVYINGQKTNTIRQDVNAKMPAESDFTLPLKLKVPLNTIFQDLKIQDLLKSQNIQYSLRGHLKVGLGKVEVKIPVDYGGEETLGR